MPQNGGIPRSIRLLLFNTQWSMDRRLVYETILAYLTCLMISVRIMVCQEYHFEAQQHRSNCEAKPSKASQVKSSQKYQTAYLLPYLTCLGTTELNQLEEEYQKDPPALGNHQCPDCLLESYRIKFSFIRASMEQCGSSNPSTQSKNSQ